MDLSAWLIKIGEWFIKKGSSKVDEIKLWQQVYLNHIDFLNKEIVRIKEDYEKTIEYITLEKEKHPENGFELDKHKETLDFYYNMVLKLIEENRKLLDDKVGLTLLLVSKKIKS